MYRYRRNPYVRVDNKRSDDITKEIHMFKPLTAACFASLASLCLIPSDAAAKCGCPDDGRGAPAAATGLG